MSPIDPEAAEFIEAHTPKTWKPSVGFLLTVILILSSVGGMYAGGETVIKGFATEAAEAQVAQTKTDVAQLKTKMEDHERADDKASAQFKATLDHITAQGDETHDAVVEIRGMLKQQRREKHAEAK